MSYENEKLSFSKEHINIIEIDLDYCEHTFGSAPCAAVGSGDDKCSNTFGSCHYTRGLVPADPTSEYLKETKTYRFCEDRSPHPIGLDAIPSLLSVNISPAKIDLSGGLGVRASVSLSFKDHPSSDIGIDKYVDDRSYIAFERGSYWTKLRARNANYENRPLRVLSGYLVDGAFDPANFITRYYIIDKMNVTNGRATITAKDPLKLAGSNKAQAPKVSTGQLSADLLAGATTAILTPAGVGNLEYPTTGKILINSEVISFIRSGDDLTTLTRAQNNTLAKDHNADDTVQLCLEYDGEQVDFIVKDLLTNYASIDPVFIPDAAWSAEIGTFLSGGLSGIIAKPFDVFKLLKELAESMPHYLWWDERTAEIQLTALKAPPINADVIDMEGNIVAGTFKTSDKPELRKSTIFINFGQFDPTKKLDEPSNYQQTYARVDTDSIVKYGSNEIKTINSRWISNTNKGAALQLGALIGRRFSDVPREVSFSLEAKDSNFWVGQSVAVNHRDITDFSGLPVDTVFQLLSSKEGDLFDYSGIEFTYGGALDEDEGGGDPDVDLVFIPTTNFNESDNYNMRDAYDVLFPGGVDASTQVKFIISNGVNAGSKTINTAAIDTGSWPEINGTGTGSLTLQVDIGGFAIGKGGDGGNQTPGHANEFAENGGVCILLNHALTLINNGVIGGGGGGGGGFDVQAFDPPIYGGGGAGFNVGLSLPASGNGTLENGGSAVSALAGNGGNLGQNGTNGTFGTGAGAAGFAINKNGFTLTQTVSGDIRGFVVG